MSAQPIRCDTGNDSNIAIMLITNLIDGHVVGLCGHCVPDYLRGVAQAFDTALTAAEAEPDTADADAAGGDGGRKPTRPRKRTPEPQAVPAGADDQPSEPASPDAPAD